MLPCSALHFGALLRGIRANEQYDGIATTPVSTRRRVASPPTGRRLAGALYAPFAGFANTELLFWLLSASPHLVMSAGPERDRPSWAPLFMLMEHHSCLDVGLGALLGLIFIASSCSRAECIWDLRQALQLGGARTARG